MKSIILTLILSSLLTISCDRVKKKTKETINEGGEAAGQVATEFFEGVSEGVDKTLQCELSLSQELMDKGLKTGKFSIENNPDGGSNNRLTLYLIFDQDFNAELNVRVLDKNDLEIGRTKLEVEGKAGNAGYYDFAFDQRTDIEVKSKINIE